MIIGLALIGVGAALAVWGEMRIGAANPTSRLSPWGGPPPHSPSGSRFLYLAVTGFWVFGVTAPMDDSGLRWLWALALLLIYGAMSVNRVMHNRKVARTE